MKLGIVGTGKIVKEFLPELVKLPGLQVEALCSTPRSAAAAGELCALYGIPRQFTDYEAMLPEVDAVYIAVPNHLHRVHTLAALRAGKHVIVEKPMAVCEADAREMAEEARARGLFLFEAVTTQYLENYACIRELLPRVGTVKLVQCCYSQYSSRYDAFCAGEILPAFDPACAGGALMDLNFYNVSYIVGLFGEPKKVSYSANIERGIDTSGVLTMDYNGFKAVAIGAKDCAAPARLVIQGTKGYILQKTPPNVCGPVTFHANDGTEEHFSRNGKRPRMVSEFEVFVRTIDEGDMDRYSGLLDTSLAVSRVLTAARRSAGIVFPSDRRGR